MNLKGSRTPYDQVPKHAARCEFLDVMGRMMAVYQECVLFDKWQLRLVGHSRKKHDELKF